MNRKFFKNLSFSEIVASVHVSLDPTITHNRSGKALVKIAQPKKTNSDHSLSNINS